MELCKDMGLDYTKYAANLKYIDRMNESKPTYDEVVNLDEF